MSYAVTDAVEDDMKAEFKALEQLYEDVDEAASLARDCTTLCPEAKPLLDLCWWFTEESLRSTGHGFCGHVAVQTKPFCQCCHHFAELRARAQRIRRLL